VLQDILITIIACSILNSRTNFSKQALMCAKTYCVSSPTSHISPHFPPKHTVFLLPHPIYPLHFPPKLTVLDEVFHGTILQLFFQAITENIEKLLRVLLHLQKSDYHAKVRLYWKSLTIIQNQTVREKSDYTAQVIL
jgi:hypothetical protein